MFTLKKLVVIEYSSNKVLQLPEEVARTFDFAGMTLEDVAKKGVQFS